MKRPKKEKYTLNLSTEQIAALQELSAKTDIPIAQHVRQALAQYLVTHGIK